MYALGRSWGEVVVENNILTTGSGKKASGLAFVPPGSLYHFYHLLGRFALYRNPHAAMIAARWCYLGLDCKDVNL